MAFSYPTNDSYTNMVVTHSRFPFCPFLLISAAASCPAGSLIYVFQISVRAHYVDSSRTDYPSSQHCSIRCLGGRGIHPHLHNPT